MLLHLFVRHSPKTQDKQLCLSLDLLTQARDSMVPIFLRGKGGNAAKSAGTLQGRAGIFEDLLNNVVCNTCESKGCSTVRNTRTGCGQHFKTRLLLREVTVSTIAADHVGDGVA